MDVQLKNIMTQTTTIICKEAYEILKIKAKIQKRWQSDIMSHDTEKEKGQKQTLQGFSF